MDDLTLTARIRKKPHVTQVVVDQELILLEETSQTYFGLNTIGAKIWSLFQTGTMTLIDLAQYLQKEYQLDEQQSMQDARQFVEHLLSNHLVYVSD